MKRCPGRAVLLAAIVAVFALALAASATDHEGAASRAILAGGPHAVGEIDVTLVDTARGVPAVDDYEGAPVRTLEVTVWYPARDRFLEWLRPSPKPFAELEHSAPLVVYSHGFMSFRSNGGYLAEALASRGYVVASLDFPLTNYGAPAYGMLDIANQPGDVSFVYDALLAWNADPGSPFFERIDEQRIGAMGTSFGGLTTTLLTFHPFMQDARVRAAVSLAGPSEMFESRFFRTSNAAFMMVAGDIDAMVDYQANAAPIQRLAPQATLVTLRGGSHTAFAGISRYLMRWFDNPDSVGCGALVDEMPEDPDDEEARAFIDALGGGEAGVVEVEGSLPCQLDPLPSALRPARQQDLVTLAVVAFFQSHFEPDARRRTHFARVLVDDLPRENAEMDVAPGDPAASPR